MSWQLTVSPLMRTSSESLSVKRRGQGKAGGRKEGRYGPRTEPFMSTKYLNERGVRRSLTGGPSPPVASSSARSASSSVSFHAQQSKPMFSRYTTSTLGSLAASASSAARCGYAPLTTMAKW
jgi:hypothetical protein